MEDREEIASVLADIFVSSLAMIKLSEDWMEANIVPRFKDNPGNCSPVNAKISGGKVTGGYSERWYLPTFVKAMKKI